MAKLDVKALGLALGIIWGACVLIMGLLATACGYGAGFVEGMGSLYIGYKATVLGSLIGGVIGFIDAGIGGLLSGVILRGNVVAQSRAARLGWNLSAVDVVVGLAVAVCTVVVHGHVDRTGARIVRQRHRRQRVIVDHRRGDPDGIE